MRDESHQRDISPAATEQGVRQTTSANDCYMRLVPQHGGPGTRRHRDACAGLLGSPKTLVFTGEEHVGAEPSIFAAFFDLQQVRTASGAVSTEPNCVTDRAVNMRSNCVTSLDVELSTPGGPPIRDLCHGLATCATV